jgi:hypothetical protein
MDACLQREMNEIESFMRKPEVLRITGTVEAIREVAWVAFGWQYVVDGAYATMFRV